jgi:hypothetical protein
MKKLFIYIFLLLTLPTSLLGDDTKTVGTSGADYPTLNEAFFDINNGILTGVITLQIIDNITESATAELFESGYGGTSNYTSVTIYPAGSGFTIDGDIDGPLISLNGAANVTIDGRVGGTTPDTKDLIITNVNIGTSASTIQFSESAANNTVEYCFIKGSETATTSGVIFFSISTTGNGNDGNTIDNNDITCDVAGRPINAVYSSGTSGSENSGNTISNNNIYDFLNHGASSNGINLDAYNNTWAISGNSFYETTSFVPTGTLSPTFYAIKINNPSGSDFSITGNFIGGSSTSCGGTWIKTNAKNNIFYALYLNVGTGIASSIQNNTIKNFTWSNSGVASWTGIHVAGGVVNIGAFSTGNTIGSTTGTGSITITGGATGVNVYGINIASGGIVDCQYNIIGSITAANSSTLATNFTGINKTGTAGTTTISNNTIGSTSTASSINASSGSTSNAQTVIGINTAGNGTITISNNTIANLTNNASNTSGSSRGRINGIVSSNGTNTISGNTIRDLTIANANDAPNQIASVCGIALSGVTLKALTGNTIYNLSNTYSSFIGSVIGLFFIGNTSTNIVSGNFIHSLSVASGSTSANIYGISMSTGATTYSNNIITLDGTTTTNIYGIYETGASGNNNNLYFNTVYIGGNVGSGTNKSYALYSAVITNIRNFRNNIFVNARSTTGGSQLHYATYIVSTGGSITCDYNDYYVSGIGGTLGFYGAIKSALPIVTGQDAFSYSINPVLTVAGSTNATDYTIGEDLIGVAGTGITTDFGLATRNNPTMGAWERIVNKWQGNSTTAWNLAGNWSASVVPLENSNIIFDTAPLRDCYLNADHSVNNITNGSTKLLVTNSKQLTIKGNLTTIGTQIDATSASSTLVYASASAQTIDASYFVSGKTFNLTIDNTPGVTLNTDFTVDNSLTINSGKLLTVSAGKQLIVTGTLTNSAGILGLVIKSDASGDGKLINNTISVPATVELYLTGGLISPGVGRFHYFIPPVGTMIIGSIPTIAEVKTSLGITYFNGDLLRFNEPLAVSTKEAGWQYFDNYPGTPPGFTSIASTNGYNIYLNGSSDIIKFTGQLNAGPHSFNLSYTTGNAGAGWNLVGNPYPCNYDLNGINGLGTIVTGISNTVYYNNNGGYKYWDVYTNTGSSGCSDILPPMTGFFIKVSSGGPSSLSLPTSSKTGSASDLRSTHKGISANPEKGFAVEKVKLVLSSGIKSDETIVLLFDDALNSFNEHYDAYKLFTSNNASPDIYSEMNSIDYFMKAIAYPTSGIVSVPLKLVLKESGTHSIQITEFENLEEKNVTLKHGSVEIPLSLGTNYTFNLAAGTYSDFQLLFGSILTPVEDVEVSSMKIWYSNNFLYLNIPINLPIGNGSIMIYDFNGRQVYNSKTISIVPGQTTQIPVNLEKGFYVTDIELNNVHYRSKIVVY